LATIKILGKPQLFLLPFAGGNCNSFLFLKEYLENDFELHFLELPGRGKRLMEPLLHKVNDAVTDYLQQIRSLRNQEKFFIYGHSLGAFLGYFVSEKLCLSGDSPSAFISSGNASPKCIIKKEIHLMPVDILKKELLKMGGMPLEILNDQDMFNFLDPIIRADFEILERYKGYYNEYQIGVPIYALMGDQEELAPKIEEWKSFTTNNFYCNITKGDHFFIQKSPESIVQMIIEAYQKSITYA